MAKQALVVVLGESLLLNSVEVHLRSGLALPVIRVDSSGGEVNKSVRSLQPELVVFELDTPRPCAILSMLREQSGTVFLGIDTNDSQVVVLNSSRHPIGSMQEFCQLAEARLNDKAQTEKGGNEIDMVDRPRLSKSD